MIIAGSGKVRRHIAYLGVDRCTNCHTWTHLSLYELSDQVRLYFLVPLPRFNKKRVAVCESCGMGWEIAADDVEALLRRSAALPAREQTSAIWNRITQLHFQRDGQGSWEEGLERVREQLRREFSPAAADYVISRRLKALAKPGVSDALLR